MFCNIRLNEGEIGIYLGYIHVPKNIHDRIFSF